MKVMMMKTWIVRLNAFAMAMAIGILSYASVRAQQPAREALGGEAKLAAIRSLSLTAQTQLPAPSPQMPGLRGRIELDFLLPGQFRRSERLQFGAEESGGMTMIETLNGEASWSDVISTGSARALNFESAEHPQLLAVRTQELRRQFARYWFALFLAAPAGSSAIEWRAAGEAELPEGRAEVFEVRGPDELQARLFLDAQSHRPLMLSYRAAPMFIAAPAVGIGVVSSAGAPGDQTISNAFEVVAFPPTAAAPAIAVSMPLQEVEIQMHLADYRAVDGVLLPHRIRTSIAGAPGELWEIPAYKINPPLSAESFRPQQRRP
jgi:hypothetical protein